MTLKVALVSIYMVAFVSSVCTAQSNATNEASSWGTSIEGVKLSITMTNAVVDTGGTISIVAAITNSSSGSISLVETSPQTDFDLLLTNSTEGTYHLTPRLLRGNEGTVTINAGVQSAVTIPVTFAQDISATPVRQLQNVEPGAYTLKATRSFFVNDHKFTLESNLLRVHVK